MKRKLGMLVCAIMAICLSFGSLAGCSCSKNKISNETTAFVVMSEEMDGVFNPFFYTAGPDGEVVGMTQIGMFTTSDEGTLAYGNNEPTVALDFKTETNAAKTETKYTIVLKNGVKFSDGVPLSIRDVLFNMYVYLDPVYTGSSTMYSTDIKGLSRYRTQNSNYTEDDLDYNANIAANDRIKNLYQAVDDIIEDAKPNQPYIAEDGAAKMRAALIKKFGENHQYVADYDLARQYYMEELQSDYRSAKEAYKDEPYNFNEVESFMMMEGNVEWDTRKNELKSWKYPHDTITTEEAAINYVYYTTMPSAFSDIVRYTATASKLATLFSAEAKENSLGSNMQYHNIEGIVAKNGGEVTIGDKTYQVATLPSGHKDDGSYENWGDFNSDWSVKDANKYQVLEITINGVDPKAKWNFGFTVAPLHYYSSPELVRAFDIETNHFGVQYASLDFMENVLKGGNKVGVPLGAGAYKATDRNDSENPAPGAFKNDNIVYFVRNENFLMGSPKIKYIRYQVINQSQSINVVKSGSVHYTMPQATSSNMREIDNDKKNLDFVQNTQLGYGYIGINAGKVVDVNLRRAIMSACDVSLCMQYYTSTAQPLGWPMSKVSWAYPSTVDPNGTVQYSDSSYYPYGEIKSDSTIDTSDAAVQRVVLSYMSRVAGLTYSKESDATTEGGLAQYTARYNGAPLKYTFTIAGANLSEHPTYNTFKKAADILNACGWEVTVTADSFALTKLATGALSVWAAAWSTTVDPDMYQVYHRNSKATSTLNWGYREMKNGDTRGTLQADYKTVRELSTLIDDARKIDDSTDEGTQARKDIYADALVKVMDLAVELPTYQRNNIFLFNPKILDRNSLHLAKENDPHGGAYSNPLSRIWEVSLKED